MGATSPVGYAAATVMETNSNTAAKLEKPKSFFVSSVLSLGKTLLQVSGVAALMGVILSIPGVHTALETTFGSAVAASATALAAGALGAGFLNLLDGFFGYEQANRKMLALHDAEKQKPEAEQGSRSFSKLKKLYASMRNRGMIQMALGAVGVTIGILSLTAIVSNPWVILGVAAFTGVALLGAQIHKYVLSRKIARYEKAHKQELTELAERPLLPDTGSDGGQVATYQIDGAYNMKPVGDQYTHRAAHAGLGV